MNAGIKPSDAALQAYTDLQLKHKYHYIIYHLKDNTSIEVEETLSAEEKFEFDDFHGKIIKHQNEPRFVVVDFKGKSKDGRDISKIFFIYWSPDSAKIKPKMVYSSCENSFRAALTGISKRIQANDPGDIDEDALNAQLH